MSYSTQTYKQWLPFVQGADHVLNSLFAYGVHVHHVSCQVARFGGFFFLSWGGHHMTNMMWHKQTYLCFVLFCHRLAFTSQDFNCHTFNILFSVLFTVLKQISFISMWFNDFYLQVLHSNSLGSMLLRLNPKYHHMWPYMSHTPLLHRD